MALLGPGAGAGGGSWESDGRVLPHSSPIRDSVNRSCGARRALMRAILHARVSVDARALAETAQQLRGKLEPCALGGQLARHPQLQRTLEAILARALLDHAHQRRGIDA